MSTTVVSVVCDLCGSDKYEQLPYAYSFRGNHLFLVQCLRCGLRFVNPRPSEGELLNLYSAEYFEKDYVCGLWEGDYISNKDKLAEEAHHVLDVLGSHGISGGVLLDVGCAGGYFLAVAHQRGFEVVGVEINQEMAEFAHKLGYRVHMGPLESARFVEDSFDVVVLCDVLEHLASPRYLLGEIRRILKPNGCLYIRGPIDGTLAGIIFRNVRMLRGRQVSILPGHPYHLYEFTPRTLQEYLRMTGFLCTWMRTGERFVPEEILTENISVKGICELVIRWISKCASLFQVIRMGDFVELVAWK